MSVDTQRGEAYASGAAAVGICDYCGRQRPVTRLDDRAYVACEPCATDIRCYQAVTDEEAVSVEDVAEPGRRRRRSNDGVADKRRKWLSRLGRAIDHAGAGRLTVVELHVARGQARTGQAPFLPASAPAWADAAAEYLDAGDAVELL